MLSYNTLRRKLRKTGLNVIVKKERNKKKKPPLISAKPRQKAYQEQQSERAGLGGDKVI